MPVQRHFAESYLEARDKFRAAVAHARVPSEVFNHPTLHAPDGGPLTTDIAYFGAPEARNLLVLVSGVHGIEGYAGSGCQVALMERVRFVALPMSTAVLVVHAVDPYGFAFDTRGNEHGVDLNCNAIDHARPPATLPLYDELHALLVADAGPDALGARVDVALDRLIEAHGEAACVEALTAGQYGHPDGLVYGGTEHEWSTRTFLDIMRRWGANRQHIALVDIHASPAIPGDHGLVHAGHDPAEAARAWGWFGLRHGSERSFCTPRTGNLVEAAAAITPGAERTPVQLHFETVPWRQALDAWRDVQHAARHRQLGTPRGLAARRALRDCFYVDTPAWKATVVRRGEEVIAQALAGLQA